MHSKLTFAGLLLMCVGMTITSSCATDPIMPSKTELYNREFIKNFGVFDRSNDWNYSNKASVTVTTPSPTDIKIYANVNGKRYLFGTFLAVNGAKELSVDVPKGVTSLILRANGKDVVTTSGAKVNLGRASRIVWEHQDEDGYFNVSISENRIFRTPEEVLRYREKLPEGDYNVGAVTEDFMFISKGPFYIYPAYFNTSRYLSNIIGIYHYNEDGKIVTQDFFKLGDGKLMTYTKEENPKEGEVSLYSWQLENGTIVVPSKATKFADFTEDDWDYVRMLIRNGKLWFGSNNFKIFTDFKHDIISDQEVKITGSYKEYGTVYGENGSESIPVDAVELAFQGIKVDIPKGQKFGMYIKLASKEGDPSWGIDPNHTYFFSESALNADYLWAPKPGFEDVVTKKDEADTNNSEYLGVNSVNPRNAIHAASFTREDGMIRLCFEDWYNNNDFASDFDLNDMVFYLSGVLGVDDTPVIDPEEPEIPDTPYEWIIAVEDLGATDDFDFNDVVFGVSNPVTKADGKKYVTVRALASGGTLPVYVRYKGVDIVPDVTNEGEFHSWFEGNHPSNVVINAQGVRSTGKSYELQVDDTFTLSCLQEINGTNMGGFSVRVVKKDNSEVTEIAPPNLSEGGSEAPQMMCLPISWQWPIERTHISDAYAEFANWTKNHEDNTDWHKNVTAPSLVWKRTDIAQ